MTTKTYNGWANRATWNVVLWLGNDKGLYNMVRAFKRSKAGRLNGADAESFVRGLWPDGKTPDGDNLDAVRWGAVAADIRSL